MSDEPSAPADGDDEFADLAPPSRGKSPILAAAVIVLAAIIVWHLRADIAFAFKSRQPADLGDARTLATRGVTLDDNAYVTVSGQAERRYALFVEARGERTRETIFRLLGAGTRLFVSAVHDPDRVDLAERWTGRLRQLDALPYAASLKKYYANETQVTRFLDLASVKAALSGGGSGLRDRMGEPATVAPEQPVVVDVSYPGQLKLWLSKDKYPSAADAQHELERAKLSPTALPETKDEFVFAIPLPDARKNEIIAWLSDQEIPFQPRQERYTAPFSSLKLDGDTLAVAGEKVRFGDVLGIGVPTPVVLGGDTYMLLEGESPSSYWWAPLVAALLLAFAAFNVWYFARTFRTRP